MSEVPRGSEAPECGWIETARVSQRQALPDGGCVLSCSAPLGTGGLGRHLEELVEAASGEDRLDGYLSGEPRQGDATGQRIDTGWLSKLLRVPPVRFSTPWRTYLSGVGYDRLAARRLPASEHFLGFNGQSWRQMRVARQLGYESVGLVSANCHLDHVRRQHRRAYEAYPLERPFALGPVRRRNHAEYRVADTIYVASRYARESFLAAGIDADRLAEFPLTPHARFRSARRKPSGTFDVVYVGSLSVHKGVPLLIDAVAALSHDDLRLVLVGGWQTRGMRRFVQRAAIEDPRIVVSPGDPLPHLRRAGLCVHPTYDDGFGYAPAEALAVGVPVIVSENTGMKDRLRRGWDGLVLPTGDVGALTEAIAAAYEGEEGLRS